MVLASCRLVASAVRHHNRLDAAAVNRIVVNTSADTARWMLTVRGLPVERDGGRSSGCRFGTSIILFRFPAGVCCRPVPLNIRRNSGSRYLLPLAERTIPAKRPRLPMPFGYRRDRDKALELSFRLPLFGECAFVQRLCAAQGDLTDS
jgi:hypothetical protein